MWLAGHKRPPLPFLRIGSLLQESYFSVISGWQATISGWQAITSSLPATCAKSSSCSTVQQRHLTAETVACLGEKSAHA
ncbi:hypothetical protein CsSME_00037465 [Camellia sinensis var. sinensis]